MRKSWDVKATRKFARDLRREASGRHARKLDALIHEVTDILRNNKPFPYHYRDHALTGDWVDHRDCHLRPDLVLIYRFLPDGVIEFVRLGSHSELDL